MMIWGECSRGVIVSPTNKVDREGKLNFCTYLVVSSRGFPM